MSYAQQDELAQLFARNMALTQQLPQSTPDKQFMMMQQDIQPQPQIVYCSQHYTGTYYLSVNEPTPEKRADSPFDMPVDDLNSTLRQNNIDPAALTPAQIKLFINADNEQRLRLMELWRIAPLPNRGQRHSYDAVWPLTSLAQEEELARLRYESCPRGGRDHENSSEQLGSEMQEAEPYVVSGYANAQRIDPIYAAATGAWQAANYTQVMQTMEMQHALTSSQLGLFQAQQNDEMVM